MNAMYLRICCSVTTRSAKVGKVISEGREDDDDDGADQAGPPMA
jgi:hypothetical protein